MLNEKQQELSLAIQKLLKDNIDNNKFNKALRNETKGKVTGIKIINTQSSRNDYINFSMEEIYWMAKFLNNAKQYDINFEVNLEDYFTLPEIRLAEQFYIEDEVLDKDFIILDNVDAIPDGTYVCTYISVQDIAQLWSDGRLHYNMETQRESTLVRISIGDTGYVRKPTIHQENVAEIKQAMIEGEFVYNELACNILCTGMEEFYYNKEKRQLTIYKVNSISYFDCLDGAHRSEASLQAVNIKPNIKGFFQLKIFNYDSKQAQRYVNQQQKASPIDKEKKDAMEQNKYNDTVSRLNVSKGSSKLNAMFMKISDVPEEVIISHQAYCLVSTISDTLKDQFSDVLITPRDNVKIANYLVDYYNEIIGLKMEDFKKLEEITNNKNIAQPISTYNNMFVFYTCLSKKIYGKENWRDLLELFISDLDMSENNPVWKELQITSKRLDKRIRTKIYAYVDEKFEAFKEVI